MTASTSLREGQIVRYHGSITAEHGVYRVAGRWTCDGKNHPIVCEVCRRNPGERVLYNLAQFFPGCKYEPGDETPLMCVRPKSVTHVPARDVMSCTCPECGAGYWHLRGEQRPAFICCDSTGD